MYKIYSFSRLIFVAINFFLKNILLFFKKLLHTNFWENNYKKNNTPISPLINWRVMIPARPLCKLRDTIQVLFKQHKGEKVKTAMVNITRSLKSSAQSQGMREREAVMKRGRRLFQYMLEKSCCQGFCEDSSQDEQEGCSLRSYHPI